MDEKWRAGHSTEIGIGKSVYCDNLNNLTDSYIVLEWLESNMILSKSVYQDCSGIIGHTIEAKICNDLSFCRYLAPVVSQR